MAITQNTDFTNNALADVGITVVRTPVTRTQTTDGDEVLVEGTPEDIQAVYNPKIDQFTQNKLGLDEQTTAYIMIAPTQDLNKDDKIKAQDKIYGVINIRERKAAFGDVSVYKFIELYLKDTC